MAQKKMRIEKDLEALQNSLPLFSTMEHLLVVLNIDEDENPTRFECSCGETVLTAIQFLRHQLNSLATLNLTEIRDFAVDKTNELIEEKLYNSKKSNTAGSSKDHNSGNALNSVYLPYEPLKFYQEYIKKYKKDDSETISDHSSSIIDEKPDECTFTTQGTSQEMTKKPKLESSTTLDRKDPGIPCQIITRKKWRCEEKGCFKVFTNEDALKKHTPVHQIRESLPQGCIPQDEVIIENNSSEMEVPSVDPTNNYNETQDARP